MFIAYAIIAALAFLLGRTVKTSAGRWGGSIAIGAVSLVLMTLYKANYYAEVVSRQAGVNVQPDNPLDVMGAAIAVFAFWQGSKSATPATEEEAR